MTTITEMPKQFNVSMVKEVYFERREVQPTTNDTRYTQVEMAYYVVSKSEKAYRVAKELYRQINQALMEANVKMQRGQRAFSWQVVA